MVRKTGKDPLLFSEGTVGNGQKKRPVQDHCKVLSENRNLK
jgi:hypothetical protein